MTTIVFDGRYLAADSLITVNNKRHTTAKKIKEIEDGNLPQKCVVAWCGDIAWFDVFLETLKENYPYSLHNNQIGNATYDALVIYEDGSIDEYSQHCHAPEPTMKTENICYGSGSDLAIGAMAKGASAKEAVEIAIKFDTCSGGDITVFDTLEWCFV